MRLFTMANDPMAPFLDRFLTAARIFLPPEVPIAIIPFDDKTAIVRDVAARHSNVQLIAAEARIDAIGRRLYGDEAYRPGIPAWRYFRKLNAMIHEAEPFLFMDLNAVLLADPRPYLRLSAQPASRVIFGGPSALRRSIPGAAMREVLDSLIPGAGNGFNCGFIAGRGGVLSLDLAEALARPRLRRLLGKSPEQAFLAVYLGLFGLDAIRLAHLSRDLGPHAGSATKLRATGDGFMRHSGGRHDGRICLALKQSGQTIAALPDPVRAFLERRAGAV